MTSEEIIQRLIDEKKLTVSEAMIIMKDLAKESMKRLFNPSYRNTFDYDFPKVSVLYGVSTVEPYKTFTNLVDTEQNEHK